MKVLLLGATGGTGLHAAEAALAAGHTLTVVLRNPKKLPESIAARCASIIRADATNPASMASAVTGQEAILIVLGSQGLFSRQYDCSKGTANIIKALASAPEPKPRLVVCSSMGASESRAWLPGFVLWMLKHPLADKDDQERDVRASGLPFVIVRPTGLNDGKARGPDAVVRVVGGPLPHNQIARADVGAFLVAALASDEYLGKAVGISWRGP